MLNSQKFAEIQNDPSLLQNRNTTININIKDTLADILKAAMNDGDNGFSIIDKLRSGINQSNGE